MEHRSLFCAVYCVSFSLTACKIINGSGVCLPPNRLVYALIKLHSYHRTFLLKSNIEHLQTLMTEQHCVK